MIVSYGRFGGSHARKPRMAKNAMSRHRSAWRCARRHGTQAAIVGGAWEQLILCIAVRSPLWLDGISQCALWRLVSSFRQRGDYNHPADCGVMQKRLMCGVALFLAGRLWRGADGHRLIRGRVHDKTGAVIADVPEVSRNAGTKLDQTTNGKGFRIPRSAVRRLSRRIRASGLQETGDQGSGLDVAQTTALNVELQVGSLAESIDVQADRGLLEARTRASVLRSSTTATAIQRNLQPKGSTIRSSRRGTPAGGRITSASAFGFSQPNAVIQLGIKYGF